MKRLVDRMNDAVLFVLAGFRKRASSDITPTVPNFICKDFVVFAWNDFGMHQMNSDSRQADRLSPSRTARDQVVPTDGPTRESDGNEKAEYRDMDSPFSHKKRTPGIFRNNAKSSTGIPARKKRMINMYDF